jgi:hypothetical protein
MVARYSALKWLVLKVGGVDELVGGAGAVVASAIFDVGRKFVSCRSIWRISDVLTE